MTLRDADLITALARYDAGDRNGKPSIRSIYVNELERQQAARDVHSAKLAALPPSRRRRIETHDLLVAKPPTIRDLGHMHSVLAICGLPFERLPIAQRDYLRRQGNMALDVTSGVLRDEQGTAHVQPVPFGPKARLVLLHLCSEAVRQRSATIEIADSFTAFVREMGFSDSGGKRGPMTAFKEQLNALAACTMRLSLWTGQAMRTRNISPIEEMNLWLPTHPDQRSLWPSTVTFSPAMYDSLKRHAMPLNMHIVRALAGSARKLDLYFWLSYRIHNLDQALHVSWNALFEQFGGNNRELRKFRAHFKDDLAAIQEILPKLPTNLSDTGLTVLPAGPDVLSLPVRRTPS